MQDASNQAAAVRIAPSFLAYYGLLGVLQPYLPPLLIHRGLSSEQAGTVQGLAALLSSVAPLLASKLLGPRVAPRNMARIFGIGVSVMALLLAVAAKYNPYLWAVIIVLFALMWSPIAAIIDTLAVAATERGRLTYGQLRMSGSFGFILASSLVGWLLGQYTSLTLDTCLIVACFVMLVSTLMLPNVGSAAGTQTQEASSKPIPKSMFVLIAAMALHWGPFGSYQYSYTMLAEAVGLKTSLIGVAWSLGVISEVVCFLASDWLIKRFGWHRMMLVAFCAASLRWVLIASLPQASVVVATQALHGPGFAWFYTAAMAAIGKAASGSTAVRLQLLFTGLVTGMGACLGNFWAGYACAHMPIHRLFLLSIPTQLIAIALLIKARPTTQDATPRAEQGI